jgi:hypothetical protein
MKRYMVAVKHSKNVYEGFKRSMEDYSRSRKDYELYQDINKLEEMIKAYYDAIAKVGTRLYE